MKQVIKRIQLVGMILFNFLWKKKIQIQQNVNIVSKDRFKELKIQEGLFRSYKSKRNKKILIFLSFNRKNKS